MMTKEELAARNLARIGETHRIDPSRCALLVIDMQRAFLDPGASLYVPTGSRIVAPIRRLVDFCRASAIPVIFTEFISSPLVPTLRKDPFGPEHLAPEAGEPTGWGRPSGSCHIGAGGPESPDTIEELKPLPHELVIQAHTLDKFYGTPLDLVLRARDIRYLIVTGLLADLCVAATVYSASTREYRVTAVTDGITTVSPDILKAAFDIFGRKLARLATSEEVVTELRDGIGRMASVRRRR